MHGTIPFSFGAVNVYRESYAADWAKPLAVCLVRQRRCLQRLPRLFVGQLRRRQVGLSDDPMVTKANVAVVKAISRTIDGM